MEDFEVIEKIREYFEENYELLRLEGGHAITQDIKELALTQVLYYFQKMTLGKLVINFTVQFPETISLEVRDKLRELL